MENMEYPLTTELDLRDVLKEQITICNHLKIHLMLTFNMYEIIIYYYSNYKTNCVILKILQSINNKYRTMNVGPFNVQTIRKQNGKLIKKKIKEGNKLINPPNL